MLSPNNIPSSFQVHPKIAQVGSFAELQITRGTSPIQWTGIYNNQRITLYYREEQWSVACFNLGRPAAAFRWVNKEPSLEEIYTLVQCAMFFIDATVSKPDNP